ncbi:unnamed protein product [Peniophora sp. CBMAI 1063]|nr:unnamed protein product [Peniophora sp. CBMAI 1063]
MFEGILGLAGRSDQQSKDTSQDTVRKMLADEMETRLQKLDHAARQCEAKAKELRNMQYKITDEVDEARAMYKQLRAAEEGAVSQPGCKDERGRKEVEELHRELDDLRRENVRMAASLAERERAAQHACRERDEMAQLLAQRSAELEAAQAFLPRSESVSDSDVVELVEALNYEIMQAATTVAESFDGAHRVAVPPETYATELKAKEKAYGPSIARLLLAPSDGDPVLFLRVALQAVLARQAEAYIVRWCYRDLASSNAMRKIMRLVREHESEHVAVRWSELGHRYARAAIDKGITADAITTDISAHWADVLSTGGYALEGDSTYRQSLITSHASKQLEEVSKLVLELNKVIGQKVTRGWLRCMRVEDGAAFDPNAMEADIQDGTANGQDQTPAYVVLCTSGIGLRRAEGGVVTTLVKPKVVAVPAGASQ